MKKTVSLILAFALCIALRIPASAADGYAESGCAGIEKLTKEEISLLLANAPSDMPRDDAEIFDVLPSTAAPYSAGKVKDVYLQQAADRLNALRTLAGLPPVALDPAICAQAQYGAVLLAASEFGHYPPQPAGMDDGFYNKALDATSSSNIYAGAILTATPDGFMDDSDSSNISRLGHRRWQLDPSMAKIGFGYTTTSGNYRRYTAEKVFDRGQYRYSNAVDNYDFIGWPASGNFPSDLFGGDVAWSVTLNPNRYATPSSSVTVTLTRESDGKAWTFGGNGSYSPSSGPYFNIETSNYGVNNCIIFRPDGIDAYNGLYTVEVAGLRTGSGTAATLSYRVDFFALASVEDPSDGSPDQPFDKPSDDSIYIEPFTDVLRTDYYADAVKWAIENDVTTGTSATTFSPNGTCTRAQVVTFLWRAMGRPTPVNTYNPFTDVKAADYYYTAVLWAVENGITNGTSATAFSPGGTCTKEQVLTFLHRALGKPAAVGESEVVNHLVTGWYTPALAWADTTGVLTQSTYSLYFDCPRAEIVTYMYRALAN